jgi:hypothetical protein
VCTVISRLVPFSGYALRGSCGEAQTVGVNEVLRPEAVPAGACADYSARVLAAFGPGGPRTLDKPISWPRRTGEWPEGFADIVFVPGEVLGRSRDPYGY